MKSSLYRSPPNGYYSAVVAPLACVGMNVDGAVTVVVCAKPASRRFKTILDASVTVTLSCTVPVSLTLRRIAKTYE